MKTYAGAQRLGWDASRDLMLQHGNAGVLHGSLANMYMSWAFEDLSSHWFH